MMILGAALDCPTRPGTLAGKHQEQSILPLLIFHFVVGTLSARRFKSAKATSNHSRSSYM